MRGQRLRCERKEDKNTQTSAAAAETKGFRSWLRMANASWFLARATSSSEGLLRMESMVEAAAEMRALAEAASVARVTASMPASEYCWCTACRENLPEAELARDSASLQCIRRMN